MEFSIQYDNTHKYFYVQTKGDFNASIFKELADLLLKHPNWSPGSNCIFDYRETDMLRVERSVLQDISAMHQENNDLVGKGKSALVMKEDGNYGIGRMYQGYTEVFVDTHFFVFTDLDKAKNWING